MYNKTDSINCNITFKGLSSEGSNTADNNSKDIHYTENKNEEFTFDNYNKDFEGSLNKKYIGFTNEKLLESSQFDYLESGQNGSIHINNLYSNTKLRYSEISNNYNSENEFKQLIKFVNLGSNHSPDKSNEIYKKIKKSFSSNKQLKKTNFEICESERKFILDMEYLALELEMEFEKTNLIENIPKNANNNHNNEYRPDNGLLGNFMLVENISPNNEFDNLLLLDNRWDKILKDIEESHRMEISENDIIQQSLNNYECNNNQNSKLLSNKKFLNLMNDTLNNINNSNLNINGSNHLVNFEHVNQSLHSFYDVVLDKAEFERFLNLDKIEQQKWLLEHRKDIYDFMFKEQSEFNKEDLLHANKINFQNIAFPKHSKKRKSLLEINYCKIKFENNDIYEGEKLDPKSTNINGYGVYKYLNGDVYEGDFVDGKRHGLGEYIYSDNSYYRGEWENDFKCGRGVYSKTTKEYNGIWKNNNFISGFIFDIKNLQVEEINCTENRNSSNIEICHNSSDNSIFPHHELNDFEDLQLEELYLDLDKINEYFQDYTDERQTRNYSFAGIYTKYRDIQKDFISKYFMDNFDFLSNIKSSCRIELSDIIFNQKSIFKRFLMDKNSADLSKKGFIHSLENFKECSYNINEMNIDNELFFSDCPFEDIAFHFKKYYKFDITPKCDCHKLKQFISYFIC